MSDETTSRIFVIMPFLAICAICFCTAISYSEFYLYPEHLKLEGMDSNSIGFITGGFFVGAVIGVPLVGLLMHVVGGRPTVAFGLLCLVFAAFLLEKSRVVEIVFALRAVQGIGASAANVAGLVLATKVAPKRLAQAGALTGLSFVLGQGVAPFFAATLIARTQSFNAIYSSSAMIAALGLLCVPLLPAYAPNTVPPLPNRAVWATASIPLAATAFLTVPFLAAISLIAAYASTIALGHAVSGFFLCFMAASVAMRLGGGGLLDSLPRPQIIAIASFLAGAALILLTFGSAGWLYVSGILLGTANSAYLPSLQAMLIERVPERVAAVTIFRLTVELSGVGGAMLGGLVADLFGYPILLFIGAGFTVLGGLTIMATQPRG